MKIIHQEHFIYTYAPSPFYSLQDIDFDESYIVLDKIKSNTKSTKYEGLWIVTVDNQVTSYITKETLEKILANAEVI